MAKFDVRGMGELIENLRRAGEESGPVAVKMLQAGAEQVKLAWQRAAEEHGLRDTGAMINSIGFSATPKSASGNLSVEIYPKGRDRKGVRNVEKAFILHYGSSRIQATRWVDDADRYAEETAMAAMRAVWDAFLASR